MAYVPPALRKRLAADGHLKPSSSSFNKCSSPCQLFSTTDIRHHYWPPSASEESPSLSTLNNSAQFQFELTYLVLHHGQNPRWKTSRTVFAKTNLKLLPDYFEQIDKRVRTKKKTTEFEDGDLATFPTATVPKSSLSATTTTTPAQEQSDEGASEISYLKNMEECSEDATTHQMPQKHEIRPVPPIEYEPRGDPPHRPMAVFEEAVGKEFRFTGWYIISHVSIFAPWSQELVEMLEQKWTPLHRFGKPNQAVKRHTGSWMRSMEHEWAAIRFEKMTGKDIPEPPAIKHVVGPENSTEHQHKSVNEMLAELRLQDKERVEAEPKVENENAATEPKFE